MTFPVLLKLGAGACWAVAVTTSTVSPVPTSQPCKRTKTPFLTLFWKSKKKGGRERQVGFSVLFFLFFYYEKELEAVATNKQTWHLLVLHL